MYLIYKGLEVKFKLATMVRPEPGVVGTDLQGCTLYIRD